MAHRFGAKDYKTLRKLYANSIWLSVIFAVVMTTLTVIFCRPILTLMRTPANIFEYSYQYILIIFIGIPATYLFNLTSGMIRALGNSRAPLIILVISSFLNVILDLVFILNFNMGVAGAAAATVLSQVVSGIICVIYIRKKVEMLQLSKDEWRMEKREMAELFNAGVPMGLQYSITAIGSVILQSAVNTLGSDAVASVTAASKISMFIVCPFDSMGATMATYGGQNAGGYKLDRLHKGLGSCIILGAVYSVIGLLIIAAFGPHLLKLFVSGSETGILADAQHFLLINGLFYFPLALVNIVRFMIQGMGFGFFAIIAGVLEMAARTLVGAVFVPIFGYNAACFASPLAWIFADCFLIPAYFVVWNRMKRHKEAYRQV